MAFKALKAYKPEGKAPNLNKDQKEMAAALVSNGLPTGLAMQMASSPDTLSRDMLKSLNASLDSNGFTPYASTKSKKPEKFKSGGTAKSTAKKPSLFNRNSRKSNSNQSSTQIMDFAAEATREAEIEKDSSKGIFDIITNRYKVRAWQEFKDDILDKPEVTQ